jgi:hypothetical protein
MKNKMKTIRTFFFVIGILSLSSCSMTNDEKLDKILNSEEIFIQQNTYGGIAGYYEQEFHLKKGEYETLLILDEGTDYQTFIRMEDKKGILKSFINEAYKTDKPNRKMSNSCMTGIDSEYILKSGLTTLKLRPDEKCDSIFGLIIYDKE